MMKRFCILALVTVALSSGPFSFEARAQNVQGVAAVVNDGVVTDHDLEQRMRLSLLSSRAPTDAQTLASIKHQVLRRLIDETLQIQEGKRVGVSVSEADIENGVASIEQQNNMPPGMLEKFMASNKIGMDTIKQQIMAELSWVKVVRQQIAPTILVGDEEIDRRLEAIRANRGKPEYLAAEIFLAVDNPRNEPEVSQMANKLIAQMLQGAHFSAVARQFSDSGGASGGDLGWVSEGTVDPVLFKALSSMAVGTLSPPIRMDDGYRILLLREKRLVGEGQGGEPTVDMGMVYLRHIAGITRDERLQTLERLRSAASCDAFEAAVQSTPTAEWSRINNVKLSQLPPDLRSIAAQLAVGRFSPPLEGEKVTRMAMMCGKETPEPGLPSRDDVERQIEDERITLAARRYQRDLRRAAFVEIRQ